MNAALSWAIEALVATALLMAAILAIRAPVRRMFGAHVTYALWLLPVLRLLLPPLPAAWRAGVAAPLSAMSEQVTVLLAPPAALAALPVPTPGVAPALVMLGLWAAGAASFAGWHIAAYTVFRHRLLASATPIASFGPVRVVASPVASGPVAFGVIDRCVAVPDDFEDRYDDIERDLALAHELGHHARGDLVANWIALAILALHWFDPVAWFAFRAFRADQEMANDAGVLAGRGAALRHAYACALLKTAHGGTIAAACHLHTIADLKGRLKMLNRTRASRRTTIAGGVAVAAILLVGLGITASGTQAAETVRVSVERATGVDLAMLTAETPPPSPPPPPPLAGARPAPGIPGNRNVRRVVIVKDGKTMTYDGAAADAYIAANPAQMPPIPPVPPMPPMPSVPPMPPMPPEAAAAAAGARAAEAGIAAEDSAIRSAIAGVQAARAGIAANRDMPEAARREALTELDSAIAELRAEQADRDG